MPNNETDVRRQVSELIRDHAKRHKTARDADGLLPGYLSLNADLGIEGHKLNELLYDLDDRWELGLTAPGSQAAHRLGNVGELIKMVATHERRDNPQTHATTHAAAA